MMSDDAPDAILAMHLRMHVYFARCDAGDDNDEDDRFMMRGYVLIGSENVWKDRVYKFDSCLLIHLIVS